MLVVDRATPLRSLCSPPPGILSFHSPTPPPLPLPPSHHPVPIHTPPEGAVRRAKCSRAHVLLLPSCWTHRRRSRDPCRESRQHGQRHQRSLQVSRPMEMLRICGYFWTKTTVVLFHCASRLHHYCSFVLLYQRNTAPLCHCTSTTRLLHYCNSVLL